jgi:hypothetical protein
VDTNRVAMWGPFSANFAKLYGTPSFEAPKTRERSVPNEARAQSLIIRTGRRGRPGTPCPGSLSPPTLCRRISKGCQSEDARWTLDHRVAVQEGGNFRVTAGHRQGLQWR